MAEVCLSNIECAHEWVDLGLPSGLLWATCNVGANRPEDFGGYFAWGETTPKDDYTVETYKYSDEPPLLPRTTEVLQLEPTILPWFADVATINRGGWWRMPSGEELYELRDKCTWSWVVLNGVSGSKVTGPNGNSIFLPAMGCCEQTERKNIGLRGYYWSLTKNFRSTNTPHPLRADYLSFYEEEGKTNCIARVGALNYCFGLPIRPVLPPRNPLYT